MHYGLLFACALATAVTLIRGLLPLLSCMVAGSATDACCWSAHGLFLGAMTVVTVALWAAATIFSRKR